MASTATARSSRLRIAIAALCTVKIGIALLAVGLESSGAGTMVQRGGADPQPLVEARRERFRQMARAMSTVGRELRSSEPSAETIRAQAALLEANGRRIPSWFPAGSGPGAVSRTRAKPEIWSQAAAFGEAARLFAARTQQFRAATRRFDVAALRRALPAVTAACQGCHDRFRVPED